MMSPQPWREIDTYACKEFTKFKKITGQSAEYVLFVSPRQAL